MGFMWCLSTVKCLALSSIDLEYELVVSGFGYHYHHLADFVRFIFFRNEILDVPFSMDIRRNC